MKYLQIVFWEMKSKKFKDKIIRTVGKRSSYLKTQADGLRSGSHEHSSRVKPFKSFKIEDLSVDGAWGTSKVSVGYEAGDEVTEEIRWKKVGTEWWLASPCDEEEEENDK